MTRRLALALLVAAGCSDATPEPTLRSAVPPDTAARAPLSDSARAERAFMAESSAVAFSAADAAGDASASCAEATGAASAFRDAGRAADADRWQATADSACAALQPQLETTMQRITDSLAAARGD